MGVQKIQSVYTVVNDMEVLQAFYSQVLGLQPKFRDKDRWTQFSVAHTNFALSSAEEAACGGRQTPPSLPSLRRRRWTDRIR